MAVPTIPCVHGPSLAPAMLLVQWLAAQQAKGVQQVQMDDLPFSNGSLPDLLRLAGIKELVLDSNLDLPYPFRWEGCGGSRLMVRSTTTAAATAMVGNHHGALPVLHTQALAPASTLASLVERARLHDAHAVISGCAGANWEPMLALLEHPVDCPPPPTAVHPRPLAGTALLAWNPLPFARPCLLSIPWPQGTPPWSLIDGHGRRTAVQVIEGPLGRELLSQVSLGALASLQLQADETPVNLSHWEVSPSVLDNGLLRIELDALGQIVRLGIATRFASLTGPACQAQRDGVPLPGEADITVLERGPVRARLAVIRRTSVGELHLSYSLHAGQDWLQVQATWSGHGGEAPWLDIPTEHRSEPLRVASDWAPWYVSQSAHICEPSAAAQRGIRWAALGEPDGGSGLAVTSPRPLRVRAQAGRLSINLDGPTSFALGERMGSAAHQLSLGHVAQHLAHGGHVREPDQESPPILRLAEGAGLVPLWIRPGPQGSRELLLSEQHGRRGKALLYTSGCASAHRVDLCGEHLLDLRLHAEGDAATIPYGPYDILLLRWTPSS